MSKALVFLVGLLALAGSASAGSVSLDGGSFDDQVFNSGKSAFVKFFAPWCGHCKAMKPVWEELGSEYEASSSVLIGDVDCTVHSEVCSKHGVQGYPTIQYWNAGDKEAKKYQGGRDKASLKKFIEDNLEVKCSVEDPSGCSEKELKFMEAMKAKNAEEVKAQIERLTKMKDGKMKPELKGWLLQRLAILNQLQ